MLTKHSCQVPPNHNTQTLNPIIILPAPSGISYEALQYPVPMDQYQLIPLVINTGKIPLINHAVQAPIQYFVPTSENQRVSNDNPAKHSTAPAQHDQYRSTTTQPSPKPAHSNAAQNQLTYKYHPSTTMYSETHVKGQSASQYSYGYKIIDGNSNDQHESRVNGYVPESDGLAEPDKSKRVPENAAGPGNESRASVAPASGRQVPADKLDKQNESNSSRVLKPIVVKPNPKTTKTELKKRYKSVKNTTKLETPINAAIENGILTTLKP